MSELEFSKKPRRMTSPPQNKRKWLPGYEGVEVILETDPARIAYFAREATWGDIMAEPTPEELEDTLKEVATGKVLGAAKKGGFGFRIRASRSSMDQMLRLAEGSGGAGSGAGAQTTRDNDHRDFNIIVPNTIESLDDPMRFPRVDEPVTAEDQEKVALYKRVHQLITETRAVYGALVDAGIPPQDARYVALPLGFQTQWFHVMSLGNMEKMCEQRLCNGLTQHETNYLVRIMRDLVVERQPWLDKMLRSGCEKRGQCTSGSMLFPPCHAFPNRYSSPMESAQDDQRGNSGKYLYPPEQNDAMRFAQWDRDRAHLEKNAERAGTVLIIKFSEPPQEWSDWTDDRTADERRSGPSSDEANRAAGECG